MPAAESSELKTWWGSKLSSKNDAMSASVAAGRSEAAPAQAPFHASCFSSTVQLRAKASSAGFSGSRRQSGSSIQDTGCSLPR